MKTLLIVILAIVAAIVIGVLAAQAQNGLTPSAFCHDGATYFNLCNSGTAMTIDEFAPWRLVVRGRTYEAGMFQLGAQACFTRGYIAPREPLTMCWTWPQGDKERCFTYTCAAILEPTPEPTPEPTVIAQEARRVYMPIVGGE